MKFKVGDRIVRNQPKSYFGIITRIEPDGYDVHWNLGHASGVRSHSFGYIDQNYKLDRKNLRNEFLKDLLKK